MCNDKITCIDRQWLCDGGMDCPGEYSTNLKHKLTDEKFENVLMNVKFSLLKSPGGDDESLQHCQNKTCREDQFQCNDLTCIPGHLMCSGAAECADGSDEVNCSKCFYFLSFFFFF